MSPKVTDRGIAVKELTEHSYAHRKADPDNCVACAHAAGGENGPNVAGWLRVWIAAGRAIPRPWYYAELGYAANENPRYRDAILADIEEYGITLVG